ncbi:MAG: putative fluoride ion transporter CrcB [Acidimicrobiaceae bacterium]|nr:putative fluoride ion transporter CrcB [Acidimicrobiaceae bacterium]
MSTVILFALVAAAATALRTVAVHVWPGAERGTLLVNVAGSFALGLMAGLTGPAMTIVATGGLGALTTFSAFVADTSAVADDRGIRSSAVYVSLTLVGGTMAALAGIALAG